MRINPYINNGLRAYALKERISFHMPGHKGNADLMPEEFMEMDLTELPDTDDLNNPEQFIRMSQTQLANLYRVPRSFYLMNGATCGVQAMFTLCAKPGDKVIVDRNCHKSVISALILLGLCPVFLEPVYMHRFGFTGGFSLESVSDLVGKHPDAKAVFITAPTYYGIMPDIKGIANIAHENGMYLLVDGAHGAHFNFSKYLPVPAERLGADFVVQSVHKTLGALSGSAILHVCTDDFLSQTIQDTIALYQTSSPSYAMLAVMELAILKAVRFAGRYRQMTEAVKSAAEYVNRVTNACWMTAEVADGCGILQMDPTRVVVNFAFCGVSGDEAAQILRTKYAIEPEMSDELNVVCIFTPYNKLSDVKKLARAVVNIAGQSVNMARLSKVADRNVGHAMAITPREAYFSEGEVVPPKEALGRISKATVGFYPPGIPILVPGETIGPEHIRLVVEAQSGSRKLSGVREGGGLDVVK